MATSDVILVPVDFEEPSKKALELAKELAPRLGCEVGVLHVYQLPVYTYPGLEPGILPGLPAEGTAAAKRALGELAERAGGLRSMLREGDAAGEILAASDELSPRMVIMG